MKLWKRNERIKILSWYVPHFFPSFAEEILPYMHSESESALENGSIKEDKQVCNDTCNDMVDSNIKTWFFKSLRDHINRTSLNVLRKKVGSKKNPFVEKVSQHLWTNFFETFVPFARTASPHFNREKHERADVVIYFIFWSTTKTFS